MDGFGIFFNWIFLIAALIVALVSYKYLEIAGEHHGEYYGLILFAQCGMYFLATGTDLVTLFIGLELMALCFYVMVGFLRSEKRSNEAAHEVPAAGRVLQRLPGLRLLGDVRHVGLHQAGATSPRPSPQRPPWDPMVFLALATTAVGLLFKISAVPFHMWAPDAYEGAPTTVTAYLSVASKAASIAFLLRIFLGPLALARARLWEPLLAVVAVAHPDDRQPGRHQPDQHQAPAGLQLDLARRLHAARPDRGQRHRHQRHRGVRDGVHLHEPGRVPGDGGAAPRRTSSARTWTISPAWCTRARATRS